MSKNSGTQRGRDSPEREPHEWNIPNCFVKCTLNFTIVLILWKSSKDRAEGPQRPGTQSSSSFTPSLTEAQNRDVSSGHDSLNGHGYFKRYTLFRVHQFFPNALSLLQDPVQDTAWHLVVTSPQLPLGCDRLSDVPCCG